MKTRKGKKDVPHVTPPGRPAGMPRYEWNELCAVQCKTHGGKQAKSKKWFIGVDNFRAGSGLDPGPRKQRNLDLIASAPLERSGSRPNKPNPIKGDELIATISSSVDFNSTTFVLQPGLLTLFPWLGQLAALYQKYRVLRFEFYYKPLVSQYDAVGSRGKVVLSFDVDGVAQNLVSLQQAEAMAPHVDFMGYEKAVLALPAAQVNQNSSGLFVRTGPVPAGADPKTYDAGLLYVSTQGMSGVATVGELHARYEIELLNPVLPNSVAQPVNYKTSTFNQAGVVLVSSVWKQMDNPTLSVFNGLGIPYTGGNFIMPAGQFRINITFVILNTGGSSTVVAGRAKLNGVAYALYTTEQLFTSGAVSVDYRSLSFVVTCSGGEVITFEANANFSAGTCVAEFYPQFATL